MGAADVLDIQAELLSRLSEPNSKLADMLREQLKIISEQNGFASGTREQQNTEATIGVLKTALRGAEAFYVHPDMTPLIEWAATGLDKTDQWLTDRAPAGVGFVYFAQPLRIHDVRQKLMKVNLLLWVPQRIYIPNDGFHTATVFYSFNDLNDPDDYADEILGSYDRSKMVSLFGRWQLTMYHYVLSNQRLGPAMVLPSEASAQRLLKEGTLPSEFTNILRQYWAFWLLCGQTVTQSSPADIPRAFARRALRAKIPPRVSVIHLRRVSKHEDYEGESRTEWLHKWIVRGHWAWRRCSSEHPFAESYPGGLHCRVYIEPYVKGPENKPLVQSQKVYSLDR